MTKRNNSVTIAIIGLNHSKHVNYFLKHGITLVSVKREYKRLTITVDSIWSETIKNYCEKNGIEYKIIEYKGTSSIATFIKNKLAFLLALVVCVVGLFFAFNTVFYVDYPSTEKVDSIAVKRIVEQNVKTPYFKNKIDCKKIKEELSALPMVALTSVYLNGGVLHIEINEELNPSEIYQDNYFPIIADRDCIIEQIIVESGTALVQKGDTVKKGDVLIAPYRVLDQNEGLTLEVQAIGQVYAKAYAKQESEFNEYVIVTEYTGREQTQRIALFCGRYLSEIKPSDFVGYDETVEFIGAYGFPFEYLQITRKEKKEISKYIPFEQVKEQLQSELLDKIGQSIKKDVQILNKWCIIKNISSKFILTGIIEYVDQVGVIDASS